MAVLLESQVLCFRAKTRIPAFSSENCQIVRNSSAIQTISGIKVKKNFSLPAFLVWACADWQQDILLGSQSAVVAALWLLSIAILLWASCQLVR